MLVKKQDPTQVQFCKDCTVWEHHHKNDKISLARILINGRYPEEKRTTNLECEEILYILSGTGTIHSEKGDFQLNPGDSYLIHKTEKYYITGDNLLLTVSNAPKWTPEQHKQVD